jgi:hypothetical protein
MLLFSLLFSFTEFEKLQKRINELELQVMSKEASSKMIEETRSWESLFTIKGLLSNIDLIYMFFKTSAIILLTLTVIFIRIR